MLQLNVQVNSLLTRFHQEVFEIQKRLFWRVHVDESRRNASFATSTRTTDLMDIIFNFLGHGKDNDVLDIIKIETL